MMSIYKSNVIHKGSSAFTAYTFIYIDSHLWVKDMSNLWPLKRKNKACGFSNLTATSNGFYKNTFSCQYYIFYYYNPTLKHLLVTNLNIFGAIFAQYYNLQFQQTFWTHMQHKDYSRNNGP